MVPRPRLRLGRTLPSESVRCMLVIVCLQVANISFKSASITVQEPTGLEAVLSPFQCRADGVRGPSDWRARCFRCAGRPESASTEDFHRGRLSTLGIVVRMVAIVSSPGAGASSCVIRCFVWHRNISHLDSLTLYIKKWLCRGYSIPSSILWTKSAQKFCNQGPLTNRPFEDSSPTGTAALNQRRCCDTKLGCGFIVQSIPMFPIKL